MGNPMLGLYYSATREPEASKQQVSAPEEAPRTGFAAPEVREPSYVAL